VSILRHILAIALLLPALSAAEDLCPWMNAATAADYLDGAVHFTVTPTSCEFVHQSNGHEAVLRIEVQPVSAPHAHCGPGGTALKALGNEATACSYEGKPGWVAEQVAGRVRDQAFLVRISSDERAASPQILRDKVRRAAEQVAGILF
jgi:hypothetical protein